MNVQGVPENVHIIYLSICKNMNIFVGHIKIAEPVKVVICFTDFSVILM